MSDFRINLGTPPGMVVDCSTDHFVEINTTPTEKTMLECISDILADKDDIHLCLSGGLDSQFSLMYCLELNKNITAYTYRSFWKDTIVNSEDVYIAEQLAKKHNFVHHVIDIDLYEFFNKNKHFEYGPKFLNKSPQLSVHFYFIELLKKTYDIDHILLGGDPPLFRYNPKLKETSKNFSIVGEKFFQDVMAQYYYFCESIGVECIRDIYFHSPEATYTAYQNNLDTLKKFKVYTKMSDAIKDRNRKDVYTYKYHYYKNIIPDLIPQKSETTGFENLKKILATESGVYNKFDLLYRRPQISLDINSVWARERTAIVSTRGSNRNFISNKKKKVFVFNRNIKYPPEVLQMYKDFCNLSQQEDMECVNRYSFDF